MKVVKEPISRKELLQMAREGFGELVKAVLDAVFGDMEYKSSLESLESYFNNFALAARK